MASQKSILSSSPKSATNLFGDDVRLLANVLSHETAWSDLDPDTQKELVTLSLAHQVFPSLYRAAGSPLEMDQLAQAHKFRAQMLLVNAQAINKLLLENSIQIRWIKGAVLAYMVYDEPWLRSMRDLDFIVPMSERLQALSILTANGYAYSPVLLKSRVVSPEYVHYIIYHFHLEYHNIPIELHFNFGASRYLTYTEDDLRILWEHTFNVDVADQTLYTFAPEALIVLLAEHDVFQHQARKKKDFRLQRTLDLWLLLKRCEIDWSVVAVYASHLRCSDFVMQALQQVDDLFGLPFDLNEVAPTLMDRENFRSDLLKREQSSFGKEHRGLRAVYESLPPLYLMSSSLYNRLFLPPEKMRAKYGLDEDVSLWGYYIRIFPERILDAIRYLLRR